MQYREPVGQLLSYAELLWERNPTALPIGEPEVAERLVARLAVSSVQFLTKWSGPKNALVIRYDRLVAEPALWAARVLDLLGIEVKIARLGEIVAELSKFKPPRAIGQTVDEPYAPRDLSKTLLSPSLIAAYDSTVRERTPFVDWPRSLVTADVSSTFASAYETEAARWMRKRRARDLLAKVLPDPG